MTAPDDASFDYYVTKVAEQDGRVLGMRDGQIAYNVLSLMRPDLAEKINGTLIDPFHRDDLLPAFYEWVQVNW